MSLENQIPETTLLTPAGSIFQSIAVNKLQELNDYAFKPYKGKKLDQLTQSIKENGVMQHIIVRQTKDSDIFEIVSGHNRAKAAEQAGLTEIPAVVRVMSDEEAAILANETNITQRCFKDWLPSEKAKSIYQYHAAVKKQGKRSVKEANTSGGNSQKNDNYARTKTAKVYGVKGNIIRLYMDIHRLADELMDKLDNGDFGVTAAQNISFISPTGQSIINAVLEEDRDSYRVTADNSQKVRSLFDSCLNNGTGVEEELIAEVRKILDTELASTSESKQSADKIKNIPLEADLYEDWFLDRPIEEAVEVLKAAMKSYLEMNSHESYKIAETSAPIVLPVLSVVRKEK